MQAATPQYIRCERPNHPSLLRRDWKRPDEAAEVRGPEPVSRVVGRIPGEKDEPDSRRTEQPRARGHVLAFEGGAIDRKHVLEIRF